MRDLQCLRANSRAPRMTPRSNGPPPRHRRSPPARDRSRLRDRYGPDIWHQRLDHFRLSGRDRDHRTPRRQRLHQPDLARPRDARRPRARRHPPRTPPRARRRGCARPRDPPSMPHDRHSSTSAHSSAKRRRLGICGLAQQRGLRAPRLGPHHLTERSLELAVEERDAPRRTPLERRPGRVEAPPHSCDLRALACEQERHLPA